MIVKLTKETNALLRWLTKGASNESCPTLSGVYVDGEVTLACDGYRIHATKTPDELAEWDGKIIAFDKIPATATVVGAEEIEGCTFPHYPSILPKTEPMFEIAVHAGCLMDALKGITRDSKMVTLRFWERSEKEWGVPYEVCGETKGGDPIYALIMPMRRHDDEEPWRPVNGTMSKAKEAADEPEPEG